MSASLPCVISESRDCKATPSEKEIFIIGPGSHEFKKDIEAIKGVVKDFGFEPYFALLSAKEKGLDSFCDKICVKIRSAYFCIVLLNNPISCQFNDGEAGSDKIVRGSRPNVFYEYGLAVAFSKKVIPIIRRDMEIPFDIQHIDAVRYQEPAELVTILRDTIRATLTKGIKPSAVLKIPKIGLLLVGKDGAETDNLIVEPTITRVANAQTVYSPFTPRQPDKDLVPLGIKIWNEGDVPAINVTIHLRFPETCTLFSERDVEGILTTPIFNPILRGLFINEGTNEADAELERLGNDLTASSFKKIYVRFNTEKEKTFDVKAIVTQDNFPKKEFLFKVVVKPKIKQVN